jgi:outer membrane protein assembly factor BamE (lipoprotein component of BamABCDE complex)
MTKRFRTKLALIVLTSLILSFFSCGVQQNLSVSYKLHEGMTKQEAEAIMGAPIKSDFYKNVEEWHYCRTSQGITSTVDEFLALFFYEGKLIAKKNYSVSLNEAGGYGSCEKFIKRGNYSEPDIVVEIRSR